MVQDTYKWVLQVYFICSTFAVNKKNISMTRKRKKDKSFCREFICRCINFKLVHLFFVNHFEFHSLFKTPQKQKKQNMEHLSTHSLSLLRIFYMLCLLHTTSYYANAQTHGTTILHGYVTDEQRHIPLSGASIEIIGTEKRAISNEEGRYVLPISEEGKFTLRVSYIGYKTKKTNVDLFVNKQDSICINIGLHANSNTLQGVTILGKNKIRQLKLSALPVSVIGKRQLEGTATNVNDVLARTVGVTVRNTGGMGSASRISIRGLEGKRMGMFVDESPLGGLNNFVALNDIPTSMIERIEVYKGIVPYKFGGSALGGAVNVVTKEYPPLYFDASYEISSFNTHQLSTVLKRTNRRTGLQFGIGGVYTHSDNDYDMVLDHLDGRTVKRTHDKFSKIIGGASVKATKWWFDELKWELIFTHTRQEIQGIDQYIREAFNKSQNLITALKLQKENFFAPGLDLTFETLLSYGRYGMTDKALCRYDWDGNPLPAVSPFGGEQGNHPSDGDNKSYDWSGKLNLNYLINAHHSLNLNVCANNTNMFPTDSLMDKALGFNANFHSRMTSTTIGLSYDLTLFNGRLQNAFTIKDFIYSSDSRSISTYSISEPKPVSSSKNFAGFSNALRWKFSDELLVKASFNSEVRIPSTEELIGNGYSILPSPALKPERTTGYNIGLLYHKALKDGGMIEMELNSFYNILEDMIRFTPDMIPTMARYRNFGEVQTMGIELEAKGDVLPMLYLYANTTYQDLRDKRKMVPGTVVENPTYNMRIPNVPYFMANGGLEYHQENIFGGRGQNTRIMVDASYIHQYYYDFEMSKYQERKIPTSMIVDAAIEHTLQNSTWSFTLKVKNIANRRVVSDLNCPLPGRSVAFKVRYLLK